MTITNTAMRSGVFTPANHRQGVRDWRCHARIGIVQAFERTLVDRGGNERGSPHVQLRDQPGGQLFKVSMPFAIQSNCHGVYFMRFADVVRLDTIMSTPCSHRFGHYFEIWLVKGLAK
jgi:hypothetical protein